MSSNATQSNLTSSKALLNMQMLFNEVSFKASVSGGFKSNLAGVGLGS